MNLLEQQLTYPMGDGLPEKGQALEVAPGVRWIRMALPFALNHINLWLLRDEMDDPLDPDDPDAKLQGWTVVDCCINWPESKAQWETIFATQLEGLPILRVIVTHMHPDHIGLAHWLCERWSTPTHTCRLWVSATDYNVARIGSQSSSGFSGDSAALFFSSHGLTDPDAVAKIRARSGDYSGMVPELPTSYVRLMDGKTIAIGSGVNRHGWRCISGYGHAPEHIALYRAPTAPPVPGTQADTVGFEAAWQSPAVLIAGDMILPRISTNVSVYDMEPEADALRLFLESINKYLSLPADTLTLPSHGQPFRGLHTRISQLHEHHRDRLAEVMDACKDSPCSAADILPIMFKRELDLYQTTFAMGEALAHLHLLWFDDKLQRRLGPDAIYRFSAPAS
jgi:glyoxylase-like metal-dependent hydrolase (beta-lactamase superfamily II)